MLFEKLFFHVLFGWYQILHQTMVGIPLLWNVKKKKRDWWKKNEMCWFMHVNYEILWNVINKKKKEKNWYKIYSQKHDKGVVCILQIGYLIHNMIFVCSLFFSLMYFFNKPELYDLWKLVFQLQFPFFDSTLSWSNHIAKIKNC